MRSDHHSDRISLSSPLTAMTQKTFFEHKNELLEMYESDGDFRDWANFLAGYAKMPSLEENHIKDVSGFPSLERINQNGYACLQFASSGDPECPIKAMFVCDRTSAADIEAGMKLTAFGVNLLIRA